jgi:homoserine acetyltransferase
VPAQSEALVADGKDVSFCKAASSYGHDAFILETENLALFVSGFLQATHQPRVRKEHKSGKIRT